MAVGRIQPSWRGLIRKGLERDDPPGNGAGEGTIRWLPPTDSCSHLKVHLLLGVAGWGGFRHPGILPEPPPSGGVPGRQQTSWVETLGLTAAGVMSSRLGAPWGRLDPDIGWRRFPGKGGAWVDLWPRWPPATVSPPGGAVKEGWMVYCYLCYQHWYMENVYAVIVHSKSFIQHPHRLWVLYQVTS